MAAISAELSAFGKSKRSERSNPAMWLDAKRIFQLVHFEPDDCVVRWTVDVKAPIEESEVDEPESFTIGRFLADELRRYEIEERGVDVWDAADADSSGLEAAWAALLDEHGEFRSDDIAGFGDPIVYLYRFELHPDFPTWRMAVMDAFCRTFDSSALILAQYQTTWLSNTEFEMLGFDLLPPTRFPAPTGLPNIDRETRFMIRDNSLQTRYSIVDYPDDIPTACRKHQEWVEKQGPWTGLV